MFTSDSSPTADLQERPEAILPTMGGQTALNLAKALAEVSQSVHQLLYLTDISFLPWQPLARDMQIICSVSEMPYIVVQQGILEKYNVELIGAKLPSIDKAEDRELFKQVWLTAPALLENTISGGAPCKAWYDTRMSYAKKFPLALCAYRPVQAKVPFAGKGSCRPA